MTVLLFACAVGAAVGCYRALRRLRADEQTGTVLYELVRQLLLLNGALSVVALAFAITESYLAATPSERVVAAAFRAEQALLALRSWVAYLRVPWPATILVLLVVFLLSIPTAGRPVGTGSGTLRGARRVAAVLKRYGRLLATANVIITVGCSLTLFGAALDADTAAFRARLRGAREELEKVANGLRTVARVELQAAAASAVLNSAPPPVHDAALAVARLETAVAQARTVSERAGSDYGITVRSASSEAPRRAMEATPSRADVREPPGNAAPKVAAEEITTIANMTFGELGRIGTALDAYLTTNTEYLEKARLIAQLDSRKALTSSFVKKFAKGPIAEALGGPHGLTLTELVAGMVADAVAEAVNRGFERSVIANVVGAQSKEGAESAGELLERQAADTVQKEMGPRIQRAWSAVVHQHGSDLARMAASADHRAAQVDIERAALEQEIASARRALEARREVALRRIALSARASSLRDVLPRGMSATRSRLLPSVVETFSAAQRAQEPTRSSVETLEKTATIVESGLVPPELEPPRPVIVAPRESATGIIAVYPLGRPTGEAPHVRPLEPAYPRTYESHSYPRSTYRPRIVPRR